MIDIQKRIATFEKDCRDKHNEQYEGCLDCEDELKTIITELTEHNKKLVDALKHVQVLFGGLLQMTQLGKPVHRTYGELALKGLDVIEQELNKE